MTKIYLLFNKTTKKFLFFTENISNLPTNQFDIKEISLTDLGISDGVFNIARYRWEGDFDNGKLIDLFSERKSIVTEREIDYKFYGIFFRKYPLEEVVFELVKNLPESNDMRVFLDKLLNKKQGEFEIYRKSPNHILETSEEILKQLEDTFK